MTNDEKSEHLEFRQKHSKVEVRAGDRYNDDEFELSVTHNGYQWTTISLLPFEAEKVIEELQRYLDRIGG